jgi:hypothetical protein
VYKLCTSYFHRFVWLIRYGVFFFFFFFKKLTPQFFFFNIYLEKNNSLTRILLHVSIWTRVQFDTSINWTRVFNTRVQLDTCIFIRVQMDTCNNTRVHLDTSIKYTCPIVKMVQLDTWIGRVSTVTGTVDTRPIVCFFGLSVRGVLWCTKSFLCLQS